MTWRDLQGKCQVYVFHFADLKSSFSHFIYMDSLSLT